jgi:glucose/arabinose dehydrogenase
LADIELTRTLVAGGFDQPIFVTTRPGDDRLYVADQEGQVWAVLGDERTLVLDVSRLTRFEEEQGLLGLAFDPKHPERMIVDYSANHTGDTVIVEYAFPLHAPAADPDPVQTILTVAQPALDHNGGMIAFGPDGYFYVALGDGGGQGDEFHNGQNPFTLLGAILRLDLEGAAPYAIPPGNPFADGVDGAPEVWVFGVRNPWRFSFDDDDLWIGDVGQDEWEELDLIDTDDGGANLGWPVIEGTHCYDGPIAACTDPTFIAPIYEYPHSDGGCAIIGGYVYRGAAIPDFVGAYLFSDYCTGRLMALRVDDTGAVTETRVFDDPIFQVTSFGTDNAGEVYVTAEHEVYRVEAAG